MSTIKIKKPGGAHLLNLSLNRNRLHIVFTPVVAGGVVAQAAAPVAGAAALLAQGILAVAANGNLMAVR
jgi:hypothetical protein